MTIVVRSLHQAVERVLDQPLAFGVERGGRFVEQQQGRVAQQRAGDRDALALPARQARSAFAHEGVEPFGKRAQEILGIGVARRLPQLVFVRVPIAVAQIVARGGGEHHHLLRHHRDTLGGCRRDRRRARSTPSSSTRPRLRIVEALGELEQGRLARARRADDREPLARLHGQAEIVERRRLAPRRIVEGHILERELAARRLGQLRGLGRRADVRLGIEQFAPAAPTPRRRAAGRHRLRTDCRTRRPASPP